LEDPEDIIKDCKHCLEKAAEAEAAAAAAAPETVI